MKASSAPPLPCLARMLLATALHLAAAGAAAVEPSMAVLRPESPGSLGAVASEAVECSAIGRDLLARGGTAADALVGTTFCVGVVAMYHSGIGGGGFAIIRDAAAGYEAVDFRETAPAAAHQDMYRGNVEGSIYGGLAVGVPGEVRGLAYIHGKYGVLPWKTVMQGAIHVARNGFRISSDMARYLSSPDDVKKSFLIRDASFAEDFAPNGTLLGEGDIMTRRRYANTLTKISEQGADAFYTGEIAEAMVRHIRKTNGSMTLGDLANYAVVSCPVKSVTYRGLDLFTVGSPASGAVCLNILKTMGLFDLSDGADANITAHRFVEAMRFGYGARVELGDPDFVDGVLGFEDRMLDDASTRRIRSRISDDRTQPVAAYDPRRVYAPDGHGTSHLVSADASGMAVSLTTTVNLIFGAQIMEPASGIILNNEMNDFSIPGVPNEFGFEPSEANFIRPGKRPLSSITPVIAARPDGTLYAVVGAAGGSRIISTAAGALWHVAEHSMAMPDAVREPRLHDQLMPNTVLVEYGFDNATAAALIQRGHNVTWVGDGLSAVQAIRRLDDGSFEAASEPRQKNSGGLAI